MTRPTPTATLLFAAMAAWTGMALPTTAATAEELAKQLRDLDSLVVDEQEREDARSGLSRDIERRRLAAVARENAAWSQVETVEDWERYRDPRLASLARSLGEFPEAPQDLKVRVTGKLEGDGYRVENLVFESRPGLLVTANLYLPAKPGESMPAIVISHSHHNPKTQAELQDMGMTWARQGWVTLVFDHLGHGERRQHPFLSGDDYPESFRVSRQDYYFRYNVGVQLHLIGDSLLGWLSWDLQRGVDLLLQRDDIDPQRIIMLGAVAGGGDPAGVTAALDRRIAAVAPFNFGGPQPDYAIPDNADESFHFFGHAYWETTRYMHLGGRDGHSHWLTVASVAPRGLIYANEFGWLRRDRDPVWPRLEKVWRLYDARDKLATATGKGTLRGRPPESTHCNNIGAYHRSQIYPHWQKWFGMQPPQEFQDRRETRELHCLTDKLKNEMQPVHKLAGKLADERLAAARTKRSKLDEKAQRESLRDQLAKVLGDVAPAEPRVVSTTKDRDGDLMIERVELRTHADVVTPVLFLRAADSPTGAPIVVCVSGSGKEDLLDSRSDELAAIVEQGAVVCLPDLRGVGEARPGGNYGPFSTETTLSCRAQVLGQTVLGLRLNDLRATISYIRGRKDLGGPIAIWGDSTAEPNPTDRTVAVPLRIDNPNKQADPTGATLALLAALYEDDVKAVYARGGLVSYRSLLDSQFLYAPHADIPPGVLRVGDVADIAAALAPRSVRIDASVTGLNRLASQEQVDSEFAIAAQAYKQRGGEIAVSAKNQQSPQKWLWDALNK